MNLPLFNLPILQLSSTAGRLLVLAALLVLGACSSNGAIPGSPTIDRPEIVKSDGGFVLSWDTHPDALIPRSYQFERYHDGVLEYSTSTSANSLPHQSLDEGKYIFKIRGCGSDNSCGGWSSINLNCEREGSAVFCWQTLDDDADYQIPDREQLAGAEVEVWDSIMLTTAAGCAIPIRAIRKAGEDNYQPLVYFRGGGWRSMVKTVNKNGGPLSLYQYMNQYGIATVKLAPSDPPPVYAADRSYDRVATFASFTSNSSLLVALLNEGYLIFDVDYLDMNGSFEEDDVCQGRWQDVIAVASAVVETLYDPSSAAFALPTRNLANNLPALLGLSAGGHLAHFITTHQPEKVLRTVNISGPFSWGRYKTWKNSDAVNYNIWFEYPLLGSVADAGDRERLAGGVEFPEFRADIVNSTEFGIPRMVELNSFELFTNKFDSNTPPVYHINYAQDLLFSAFSGLPEDLLISRAQGDFFCRHAGETHATTVQTLATYQTRYNSRRLADCGGGNYLDQYYDDPDEPFDGFSLVWAHAVLTDSQLKSMMDFLRFGYVTTASY